MLAPLHHTDKLNATLNTGIHSLYIFNVNYLIPFFLIQEKYVPSSFQS